MWDDNRSAVDPLGALRLLLIEDDPQDARLVRELIRDSDSAAEIVHVSTVEAAAEHLRDASFDAILLDLNLPDVRGLHAVAAAHAGCVGQPILILTGRSQSDLAIEALRMGAQDYLIKDDLETQLLARAIQHAIERQRLLGCMRDSVRASHANEEDLRRLLIEGTEALLVVGPGGKICFANHHAERLFGMTVRELTERPFKTYALPGVELQHELVRPDGTRVVAEIRTVNVQWRRQEALLVSLRDVSERRRSTEQQLRLEMLTGFLNNMSHELRTPLSAIYQFVSNVRDGILGTVNAEQGVQLGSALRNVDEVLSMVANLLEVARSEGGKLRIDPRVMQIHLEVTPVCQVLEGSALEAGVRFENEIPRSLPMILADPVRVRQIVANLGENAIKFTPRGGTVTVSARSEPELRRVVLVVTDSGCGVPAEHLERIFDQLHQVPDAVYRTRRGLGLGLFITREIVRGLGGEIRVESEVGRGSRFEISLPVFTWASVLTPLGPELKPASTVHALVVSAGWSEDASDEPVPGGLITTVRTLIDRVLREHPHVSVPPIAVNGALNFGAILVADAMAATCALRALEAALALEPSLTDSALEIVPSLTPLAQHGSTHEPERIAPMLDRCFMNPTQGGDRWPTPTATVPSRTESQRPQRRIGYW